MMVLIPLIVISRLDCFKTSQDRPWEHGAAVHETRVYQVNLHLQCIQ